MFQKTLDELAKEQGVTPIQSIDELRGEDVEDAEEFLRAIRSLRE
jgi:hypothetical protein